MFQKSASASESARVIMSEDPSGSSSESKILHVKKDGSVREIDAQTYERGTRETIAFDQGFLVLPPDDE